MARGKEKIEVTRGDIAARVPNEDAASDIRALEREKAGYKARIDGLRRAKGNPNRLQEPLDEAALQARIRECDAEIRRLKKDGEVTDRPQAAAEQIKAEREALAPPNDDGEPADPAEVVEVVTVDESDAEVPS